MNIKDWEILRDIQTVKTVPNIRGSASYKWAIRHIADNLIPGFNLFSIDGKLLDGAFSYRHGHLIVDLYDFISSGPMLKSRIRKMRSTSIVCLIAKNQLAAPIHTSMAQILTRQMETYTYIQAFLITPPVSRSI